MKVSRRLPPLFAFFSLFVSIHCSNDVPVSSRFDLIGGHEVGRVKQDSVPAPVVDSTAGRIVNTGNSPILQLGTFNNIRSGFLIRFSSLPDSGTVAKSVALIMPTYGILGTGASFTATARLVTKDWAELSVTYDSVRSAIGVDDVATQTIAVTDTDSVSIALSPGVVTDWMARRASNFGILLEATSANFAIQLNSRDSGNQPFLRLTYAINNVDTTRIIRPDRDAFVIIDSPPPPTGPLYVSHGTGYNTLVKFDVSAFDSVATVNRAQLIFTVDSTNSLTTGDGMFIQLYRLTTETNSLDPIAATQGALFQVDGQKYVTQKSTSVSFELGALVQAWLRPPGDALRVENFGLLLLAITPSRDLQQIAFHSKDSNPGLAPRLRIDYTLPPGVQ
jgi:hypothetical protein